MSKVFVSFLGTNDYLTCNYCFGSQKVTRVRFVQDALIQLFCEDFGEDDRILIFLTREARKKNWNDNENRQGLASLLNALSNQTLIQDIDIPDGSSEEEIWQIFSLVYHQLNQGDEVIIDITHGFRSLPMLGTVLLNYARVLKEIEIRGIYYGAFETLGPVYKVKKMEESLRNAPIFDLSSFDTLMQWSSGAENFAKFGNPDKISRLLKNIATPRLRQSRGKDDLAYQLHGMAHQLDELAGQIATNRGTQLTAGTAAGRISEYVEQIRSAPETIPAFHPLLDMIKNKVSGFQENSLENCLAAVGWCIEHDLVQQGLTLLQEAVISIILDEHNLDWRDRDLREIVSDCFHVVNMKKTEKKWSQRLRENRNLGRRLISSPLLMNLASDYDALSKYRNDINHAGFTGKCKSDVFRKQLKQKYEAIQKLKGDASTV